MTSFGEPLGGPFGPQNVVGFGCPFGDAFGVALGIIASEAQRVPDDVFLIAAETVAGMVSGDGEVNLLDYGVIYPEVDKIRDVSVEIAVAVAKEIHARELTDQKRPTDFRKLVSDIRYDHEKYDNVLETVRYDDVIKSDL